MSVALWMLGDVIPGNMGAAGAPSLGHVRLLGLNQQSSRRLGRRLGCSHAPSLSCRGPQQQACCRGSRSRESDLPFYPGPLARQGLGLVTPLVSLGQGSYWL